MRGSKITIRPEQLAAFQHAPLSVSEEVQGLEREHLNYEDLLAFLATGATPNPTKDDPRPEQEKRHRERTCGICGIREIRCH